jgi:hypothetical protein
MFVERPGASIYYQTTGTRGPDVFLHGPCQPATHSRMWKAQILWDWLPGAGEAGGVRVVKLGRGTGGAQGAGAGGES